MGASVIVIGLLAAALLLAWLVHYGLQRWLPPELAHERALAEQAFDIFLAAVLAYGLTWHYLAGRPWHPLLIGWGVVSFIVLVLLGIWWLDRRMG